MSLTAYLRERLLDLLEEMRVVVWYDGDRAFGEVARAFPAPNTAVVASEESRLRARQRADEVFWHLNEASEPAQLKNGNLLIYCPWADGRTDVVSITI